MRVYPAIVCPVWLSLLDIKKNYTKNTHTCKKKSTIEIVASEKNKRFVLTHLFSVLEINKNEIKFLNDMGFFIENVCIFFSLEILGIPRAIFSFFFTTFMKSPRLFEVLHKFLIHFEKWTYILYSTVLSYTGHYSDLEVNSVYSVVAFYNITRL